MLLKTVGASALAAAVLLAVPGIAQEAAKEEKKVERVIILEHDGKGEHKPGEARRFRMHRSGDGPMRHALLTECDGEKIEVGEEAEGEKGRTKIVVCTKGNLSAEERAKRLEEIRSKLAEREHLSAEHRARMEAALQKAIDKLRASN